MFWSTIAAFFESTGIAGFFISGGWKNLIMIVVACVLLFLAIKKDFEPYLLLPIAFGMLLVNIPVAFKEVFAKGTTIYDASMLAGAVNGVNIDAAEKIFTILEKDSATTLELHNLVMNDASFVDATAERDGRIARCSCAWSAYPLWETISAQPS